MSLDYSNTSERRTIILDKLKTDGQVFVSDLAEFFQVSQETIRRDLNKLEEQRKIKKIHGGAVSNQFSFELEFNERTKLAQDDKRAIARRAAALIKEGDSLFIDFGTTTLEFARRLVTLNGITVMTNSPLIASVFHENNTINVILIGGQFINSRMECVGPITLDNIGNFFADYAVIGAGAVAPATGIMDQDIDEAAIAKKMIGQSNQTIVLADGHKLNNRATSLVSGWKNIDYLVITDPHKKIDIKAFPSSVTVLVAEMK